MNSNSNYEISFLKGRIEFAEDDYNDAALRFLELIDGPYPDSEILKKYLEYERCRVRLERLKERLKSVQN